MIGLAAGTGVLPVVAGLLWLAYAARGVLTRAWAEVAFARVVVVVGCVLFATTLYSQSFYLGPATEERYYFYVAPLLIVAGWRGVLGRLSRAQIAAGSVVMVACASILTLPRSLEDPEANFFAPGLATARSATELLEKGLTAALGRAAFGNPDLVAAVFALILGFTAVLRRLLPTGGGSPDWAWRRVYSSPSPQPAFSASPARYRGSPAGLTARPSLAWALSTAVPRVAMSPGSTINQRFLGRPKMTCSVEHSCITTASSVAHLSPRYRQSQTTFRSVAFRSNQLRSVN